MDPKRTGQNYDKIAQWWDQQHKKSDYGVDQVRRALTCLDEGAKTALDVGCGAGGRMVTLMQDQGLTVTGIDVSLSMVELAKQKHPDCDFQQADICVYETDIRFDFILAWDSIFHLPFASQRLVVEKLCGLLNENGILIYTFGNAEGDHISRWHDEDYYYSSIGVKGNLSCLLEQGVTPLHFEFDQYPADHCYVIARNGDKPRYNSDV